MCRKEYIAEVIMSCGVRAVQRAQEGQRGVQGEQAV